ncbi:ATP-dependent DNA helicase [Paludibacter sp. 221]|uniref:ATP-dependent helicase n=1 Tax=Paludibacter sp. 221 TaxID=2302939 RepID=UPI0013D33842|nr:UvrD-helicase domain-containing protein [Paludibacter sp. 221]NDV45679.1 ATP-dependent DNA helicase [Paludibacter sp. 221]
MEFPFLDELNDSQRQAVIYTDGPSLVIAGAGSGKTRVLTYKIAYLLKMGMRPNTILALTFTNKAAKEMKSRIAQIVGENVARYLWMGTFHSIFSRILRAESEKTGYSKNFTIYDSADSKSLIKAIIKEMKLDDKVYKPGLIQSRISFAKNNLITPQAYASDSDVQKSDLYAKVPLLKEIYQIYSSRCKQADAMDFDDLLLQTNLLFRNHPDALQKYQHIFQFILVDEYQDTNFAQYLIVKKLAEAHKKICVVGDDAQSIYSFRGANIDNILQFKNTYPEAKVFKLERNYRSTKNIVNAANSLIDKNSAQIKKTIFSEKETGELIKVTNVFTDLEEGMYVADNIKLLNKKENYGHQDIAVLYRTNSQSRVIEEALRKQNIPYRIYGGLSFYQRKEIKDVIAYFRLVANRNDEEALKRIINYPARGIGDTTVGKLFATAQLHGVGVWDVLNDMLGYNLPVNAGTAAKLANFRDIIDSYAALITELNAYELAQNIIKGTGILSETFLDRSPENLSKQENIQELLKAIHEFCDEKEKNGEANLYLSDYLAEISLLTDQDTDKGESNRVTLMTVHAAKGLEFKVVFIVGMEEELFPSPFNVDNERDLEEERRLFYVAITRAEERCLISYARSRFRNGKTNFSNPSRFLKDIDERYLDIPKDETILDKPKLTGNWDDEVNLERMRFNKQQPTISFQKEETEYIPVRPKRLAKLPKGDNSKVTTQNPSVPVGAFVKHSIFGIGKVLETSIVNGNEKAEIDFGEKGVKSLLLKFAKLEILQ